MGDFKLYIERGDVFGFEHLTKRLQNDKNGPPLDADDEKPVRPFNVQWMMDTLSRQKLGKRIKSSDAFLDHVTWGNGVGSIRVRLTPNILAYLERLIEDNLGQMTWITKVVFKVDLVNYAGQEEQVAYDLMPEVEKLYFDPVDNMAEDYDLLSFVKRLVARVRDIDDVFNYQDTKKQSDDYYVAYFSLTNVGVGRLLGRRHQTISPEVTLDINFNRERGLIRIIVGMVTAGGDGYGWQPDVPFADCWYAPTQHKDEIIDTVLAALKYY